MTVGDPDGQQERVPGALRRTLPWLALAAACLAADLWTKWAVFYPQRLEGAHVADLTSWFALRIAYNQGVTFGLASGASTWLLAAGTSLVIALLVWQLWTARADERAKSCALAMIIGGAVGNLYDRTLRPLVESDTTPGVRDFLDWHVPDHWALARWLEEHVGNSHWYTSNVADVLIVCGVIMLAWLILTEKPVATDASTQAATNGPSGGAGDGVSA